MSFYLALFFFTAVLGLTEPKRQIYAGSWRKARLFTAINWLTVAVITSIVGLRFQVGGDWGTYVGILEIAGRSSPWHLLEINDPAYLLINWISYQLGLGIYGVNLVCGFIFAFGVMVFCKRLPRPWLALAVSIPYLLTVVAMGYTRQSVAIGLLMLAVTFLARGKIAAFVFLILIAATFHKSAIVFIGFLIFTFSGGAALVAVPAVCLFLAVTWLFVGDYFLLIYRNYVIAEYQSSGAVLRTLMTALPALIFIVFRKHFYLPTSESRLWWAMSLAAITLFLLALISPATTAIDRMALYFIPIQLLVASYLPDILNLTTQSKKIMKGMVVSAYAVVYLIWMGFADHAYLWVPYQTVLLQ